MTTLHQFVGGDGIMRGVVEMETRAPVTASDLNQQALSDHLSERFHGSIKGQPEEREPLVSLGVWESGMPEPLFSCYEIERRHGFRFTKQQLVDYALKHNYCLILSIDKRF